MKISENFQIETAPFIRANPHSRPPHGARGAMIRNRFSELDRAVARAIEMLRAAKYVEEVAQGVLELLGQAACSERATFWTADADLRRLRALASWSIESGGAQTREGAIPHRTAC